MVHGNSERFENERQGISKTSSWFVRTMMTLGDLAEQADKQNKELRKIKNTFWSTTSAL